MGKEAPANEEFARSVSDDIQPKSKQGFELTPTGSISAEAIGGQSVEDLPPHYFRSFPFLISLLSVSLAWVATLLGFVMISTSVAVLEEVFGQSDSAVWVVLNIILGQTVFFTLNGRLSDIFGRRYFFIYGSVLGFIGTLVSGSAENLNTIIGGNFIIGMSYGVQQIEAGLFLELVPNKYRMVCLGVIWVTFAPLIGVGPGLARVVMENTSWRWVFYLFSIINGLVVLLQLFFYFPPNFHQLHKGVSKAEAIRSFDYVGLGIFCGSLVSFVLGMSWAGQKYPWKSASVIVPIIVGAAGMAVFVLWEHFAKLKEPLVGLSLFKSRNFICLTFVSGIGSMIFFALNLLYPQQVAAIWAESSEKTGWMSCTVIAGTVFGQGLAVPLTGYLTRWVPLKWQLITTCVLFTAFIGGMAEVTTEHKARAIVFSFISSTMIGVMEVITFAGAPLQIDNKDMGLATGVVATIRGVLATISTSVYSAILSTKMKHYFATEVAPAAVKAGLPTTSVPMLLQGIGAHAPASTLLKISGVTPSILQAVQLAVVDSYAKTFQLIYLVSLAFGGMAIVFALSIDQKAFAAKMTNEVARKLQQGSVVHGVMEQRPDPEKAG